MEIAEIHNYKCIDNRCYECVCNLYERLFSMYPVSLTQKKFFYVWMKKFMDEKGYMLIIPEMQCDFNRRFCEMVSNPDPFAEQKEKSNQIAMSLYVKWKPIVLSDKNPIDLALRLSIAGNIMDYGSSNSFNIFQTIKNALNSNFAIDHSLLLKEKINKANHILFLGDNAGEIVFDKLFIETIMHHNITYVVRGSSILNDATIHDAQKIRMGMVTDVISNGDDSPSTILDRCSIEFLENYKNADLIISKGQGNLEGLINENDPRIFYLLVVKCNVIADLLKVEKGSMIVYNYKEK